MHSNPLETLRILFLASVDTETPVKESGSSLCKCYRPSGRRTNKSDFADAVLFGSLG
jgi:hypothetical protein